MQIEIQGELIDVFVKGTYLKRDKMAVAVVGTREPTRRGMEMAYEFSFELAKRRVTIVSGLAMGIDTIAHRAALDAGGRTIAVLAHGLDRIYPAQNKELAEKIVESGCLVTKYSEGTAPLGRNFLARNQLIAGLSKAVLIIEGKERSGSISTANHAANLGVEVFAVPGSGASDKLIEEGANAANSPWDILDYLSHAF